MKSIFLVVTWIAVVIFALIDGRAAQAQSAPNNVPAIIGDGVLWPKALDRPITKIGLSVYFPGNNEILARESQKHIEDACVQYLKEALANVAPEIEIFPMAELNKQEGAIHDLSIVRVYYDVTLKKWRDARTNSDVVLGAAELNLALLRSRAMEGRSFSLALFQSEPERSALEQVIQTTVKDHMSDAIVGPIEKSRAK